MTDGSSRKMAAALLSAATEAPWLPGIVNGLARRKWDYLARRNGIKQGHYTTSSFLTGSAAKQSRIAAKIALPDAFGTIAPVLLEDLHPCDAYDDIGLKLASLQDPAQAAAAACRLARAFDVVAEVPSLADSVGKVLAVVHVLDTAEPDTDVSFSDPAVPFSAFVGVPETAGRVASLRLAEGLVHEVMHLQLTLLEGEFPLMVGNAERHWSPWQQTMRPTQGVLHGYYVFRVLSAFMATLLYEAEPASEAARHLSARFHDIAEETESAVATLRGSAELTPLGREFLDALSGYDVRTA